MNKEKLKSLLLVFLIMTSVMLTQRVWFRSPLELLQTEASYFEVSETLLAETKESVLRPERLVLGFGGGVNNSHHTHLDHLNMKPYWDHSKAVLSTYFNQDPEIQVVSYEDYLQGFSGRNMELYFGEGVPSVFFAALVGSMDNVVTQNLQMIQKILIPVRSPDSIYMVDEEGIYYQLSLEEDAIDENWPDLLSLLDRKQPGSYVKYYPLFSYVGNDVLLPLSYEENLPRIFVESEVDTSHENRLHQRVRTFFDENFDFVKIIRETTGSHIYMYGYGQQEVRVSKQGRIEYTAETGNESGTNINRAFKTALEFVLRNHGFPEGAYLKNVTPIEQDGNRGFSFAFGYSMQGVSVEQKRMASTNPIEIHVYGDLVKRYQSMTRQAMGMPEVRPEEGIISPHRLIENHFNMLLEDLRQSTSGDQEEREEDEVVLEELEGDELLRRIEDIRLIYLDREEVHRRQMLIPAWRIQIDEKIYYFDAHEGIPLN